MVGRRQCGAVRTNGWDSMFLCQEVLTAVCSPSTILAPSGSVAETPLYISQIFEEKSILKIEILDMPILLSSEVSFQPLEMNV